MKDLGEAQFVLGIQIQRNRAAHSLVSLNMHMLRMLLNVLV